MSGVRIATPDEARRLGYANPDATILPTDPREPNEEDVARIAAGPDTKYRIHIGTKELSSMYALATGPYTFLGRNFEAAVSPPNQLTTTYDFDNVNPATGKPHKPGLHIDKLNAVAVADIYCAGGGVRYHLVSTTINRTLIGDRTPAMRTAYVREHTTPDEMNLVWIRLNPPVKEMGALNLRCSVWFARRVCVALRLKFRSTRFASSLSFFALVALGCRKFRRRVIC